MGPIFLIVAAAFVISWIPALVVYLVARRRFAGDRVISCPETGESQVVRLHAGHAAAASLIGEPALRLEFCSRWPERRDCGQNCLAEIVTTPDGCLVRSRLESWYMGAPCCLCGARFSAIRWLDRKPGLRGSDGTAVSWDEVTSGDLPSVLSTHLPLCFNCLVAETFRQRFPERVVDDPSRPGASRDSGRHPPA